MNVQKETQRMHRGVPATLEVEYQPNGGQHQIAYPHIHSKIEMLYCTSGSYHAVLNGIDYSFSAGDLLLINSWEVHAVRSLEERENAYWVVKVPTDLLYNSTCSVYEAQYALPFLFSNYKHPRVLKAVELVDSPVPGCLSDIFQEWESQSYGYELSIRASICRIFTWILRYWNRNDLIQGTKSDVAKNGFTNLQRVLTYVEEHFAEPLEVSQMAELCNVSYSYFSHQFRQSVGSTFNEYLNARRIAEAEKLLCTTDLNVSEISLQVGYADPAYFIQKFRKQKGVSPRKFRAIYQEQTGQH